MNTPTAASKPSPWRNVFALALPILLPVGVLSGLLLVAEYIPASRPYLDDLPVILAVVLGMGLATIWFAPMRLGFRVITLIAYLPIMVPAMFHFAFGFICFFFGTCL